MIVWSAGHNMPGYIPESDPAIFADRLTAVQYMVGDLYGTADSTGGDSELAAEYEAAAAGLEGRDAEGGDWSADFSDGYRYWVEAVDLPDDEAREALDRDDPSRPVARGDVYGIADPAPDDLHEGPRTGVVMSSELGDNWSASHHLAKQACYSDHAEDIRTKGSCDLCGGTE